MKLAFFLNAGDSGWETTVSALRDLDHAGVDWIELCVPYANPFTDGETIRASHQRALRSGVTLADTLQGLSELRPFLRTKIALMVDWSHSVRAIGFQSLARDSRAAGVDALFLHGAPPRLRDGWIAACADAGIPRVLTLYPDSPLTEQCWDNLAFVYLATQYGRAGTGVQPDALYRQRLAESVERIRAHTGAPVLFGFGINAGTDVVWAEDCGADGVIVGSRFVDWLHRHSMHGHVSRDAVRQFVDSFRTCAERGTSLQPTPSIPEVTVSPGENS